MAWWGWLASAASARRHVGRAVAFLAALSWSAIAAGSAETDTGALATVTWVEFPLPPNTIVDGPLAGQGMSQQFNRHLASKLPGFVHRMELMPLARYLARVDRGETLCSTSLIRTPERVAFLLFARHVYWAAPDRLLMTRAAKRRWDDGSGTIDLVEAVHKGLRVAVIRGRALIGSVQAALTAPGVQPETANTIESAIAMAAAERIDAVILDPSRYFYARYADSRLPLLESLGIRGMEVSSVGISCSRTALGAAVIAAVDALPTDDIRETVFRLYRPWLDADSLAFMERVYAAPADRRS